VGAAVALPVVVSTNCGAFTPDSRLAKLTAVLPAVFSPKLTAPLCAFTQAVTSISIQVPVVTPLLVAIALPKAGALA
jgi:hypothetical protein